MDRQDTLFEGDYSMIPPETGYRGPVACAAVGVSYRQLDYWARTGLVVPEIRIAEGSGSQRLYSFRDLLLLKTIKRLIDAGISLQQIRLAIAHLRTQDSSDITEVTLMSDGTSVFEVTEEAEIIDLVKGGQAMFSINLAGVWHDIEGTLTQLPTQRADETWTDELSERRKARRTA